MRWLGLFTILLMALQGCAAQSPEALAAPKPNGAKPYVEPGSPEDVVRKACMAVAKGDDETLRRLCVAVPDAAWESNDDVEAFRRRRIEEPHDWERIPMVTGVYGTVAHVIAYEILPDGTPDWFITRTLVKQAGQWRLITTDPSVVTLLPYRDHYRPALRVLEEERQRVERER